MSSRFISYRKKKRNYIRETSHPFPCECNPARSSSGTLPKLTKNGEAMVRQFRRGDLMLACILQRIQGWA
jgi:hypothetical protein